MVSSFSIAMNEASLPQSWCQARRIGSAPLERQVTTPLTDGDGLGGSDLRVLHTFKIYRPDIEGGIPAVMSSLAQGSDQCISHSILCARGRGAARHYTIEGVPVEAVASLGTLFSTPLAAGYI